MNLDLNIPHGTVVYVTRGDGTELKTKTRSLPRRMNNEWSVSVYVRGYPWFPLRKVRLAADKEANRREAP